MKIIHTSDWHIGQRLYGKDRHEEHQFFFEFLLSTIKEKKVDALIVAGDIFDVAYPSNTAEEIYFNFLTSLISTSCKTVIITGGNHDSISTLNAPKKILKYLNIYIFGGLEDMIENHIIELKADQNSGEKNVIIAALPFLRDKDLIKSVPGQSYAEKQKTLREELINTYLSVNKIIDKKYSKGFKIFTGHFHTDGSKISESEREIHFGNLGVVNANKLPKVDYWALGHIHRPQIIAKNENIRYCGSPIPLSFSEQNDEKQFILLDTNNNRLEIKSIKIPHSRQIKLIKGDFDKVNKALDSIESEEYKLVPWLEIRIKENKIDIDKKADFIARIAELKNCEILKYKFEATEKKELVQDKDSKGLEDITNKELFEHFLTKKGETVSDEIKYAYNEIIEHVNHNIL